MVNKDRLVVSAWGLLTWVSDEEGGYLAVCWAWQGSTEAGGGGVIAVPKMAMLPLNFIQGLTL